MHRASQTVSRLLARGRRIDARRRWLFWIVAAVITLLTVTSVASRVDRLATAQADLGATASVALATQTLTPGDSLATVEWVEIPVAFVPPAAITNRRGTVRQTVDAGSIITTADVNEGTGPLALVPEGWSMIAVTEQQPSGATIGEQVQVVSEGVSLATGSVVGLADESLYLAVPADLAPLVASATLANRIAVVRLAN